MIMQEITTDLYWDCNCDADYIHSKDEPKCRNCGANYAQWPEDYPDSHRAEVIKYFGSDALLDTSDTDVLVESLPKEPIYFVSDEQSTAPGTPLVPDWCIDEHDASNGFLCYPKDGECLCGIQRHHVHCGHGWIVQIG